MAIVLDGSSITVEKLVAIARNHEKVELASETLEHIKVCRAMLEDKLAKKEIIYGTNTGIGEFSEKILNDDQVKEFQMAQAALLLMAKGKLTTTVSSYQVRKQCVGSGWLVFEQRSSGADFCDGRSAGWHTLRGARVVVGC